MTVVFHISSEELKLLTHYAENLKNLAIPHTKCFKQMFLLFVEEEMNGNLKFITLLWLVAK